MAALTAKSLASHHTSVSKVGLNTHKMGALTNFYFKIVNVLLNLSVQTNGIPLYVRSIKGYAIHANDKKK